MSELVFQGSRYQLQGPLPEIGDSAPDFSLVSVELADVSLSHWNSRRKILSIMPSIELESCERGVKHFHRRLGGSDDVVLFVVSMDTPFALKRQLAAAGLEGVVGLSGIRSAGFDVNYGVGIRSGVLQGFYGRAVVVIDENDTIVHAEHVIDIDDDPDYRAAFRALGIDGNS